MPKIALRVYNREISSLIDRGQTEEAVAHCQYILQTYPKHLETYRLLGKSYLEAHRHSEALDLFQRVLAVVPDDFITHVGMSIIRGEEDDLNAAIWHMERAFEVQPSNQAIQDELKHLYGRRDGQEPQKIRLTRGALCRMYARGNQNRQAIAEIKSILAETPDRPDLEVLLARMYFLSGMTPDALALAQKILEKLPFCYDTNKLMVEILRSSNKMNEADFYLKKIIALDPYESLVSDPNTTADQIPDDSILMDKYFYDPTGQAKPEERTELPESGEETAPDWLVSDLSGVDDLGSKGFTRILDSAALTQEPTPPEPSSITQPVVTEPVEETLPSWLQGSETGNDEVIPDFLKSTGWASAGSITEETPPAQVINMDEPIAPEGEIVPGDIPDWLQTMAPATNDSAQDSEPVAKSGEAFSDWLSGLDEKSAESVASLPEQVKEEGLPPVPAFAEQPEAIEIEAEPAAQLPDWLQQISPSAGSNATEESAVWEKEEFAEESSSPESGSIPPERLIADESFPIAGGTSILSPEDVPDWLQDMQAAGETTLKPDEPSPAFASVEPPAMKPPQEVVTMALTPEEKETMPDWLAEIQQAIPVESPIQEQTGEPIDEKRTATLPDEDREEVEQMPEWLHLLDQDKTAAEFEQGESITSEAFGLESVIPPVVPIEPDTQAFEITEEKPTTSILPPNPEDAAEELPEWLREMDTMPSEGTSPVELPAESTDETFPDWLKGYNTPPAESPLPPAEPAPEPADSEEVPAWLQDLTIGTDSDANEPEVPDWLKDMQISAESGEEIQVEAEPGVLPVWLQDEPQEPTAVVMEESFPPVDAEPAEQIAGEPESVSIFGEETSSTAIEEVSPVTEEPMEVSETLLTITDKVVEEPPVLEELPTIEDLQLEVAAMDETPQVEEKTEETPLPDLPDMVSIGTGPLTLQPTEAIETSETESILTDESAAAAAAAIGIPLFAERATQTGVTESLPPLTSAPIPTDEQQPTAEVFAEEPIVEEVGSIAEEPIVEEVAPVAEEPIVEEAAPVSEEPIATEEMVSDALDSIMLQEMTEPVSEAVETPVIEEEIPEAVLAEEEPKEFVETPVSEAVEVEPEPQVETPLEPVMEEEVIPEPEMALEEEEVKMEEVLAEQPAAENLPEPEFATLFVNAQRMIETRDYAAAQPALNTLIMAEEKLDDIIGVVQEALKQDPTDFNLWMVLGDAFGHSGKLQNALDAYTKAEEYLQ